jgi:hypothetical protein
MMWVADNNFTAGRDYLNNALTPQVFTPSCNPKEGLYHFFYVSASVGAVYIMCNVHPYYFYGFKVTGAFTDIFIPLPNLVAYYNQSYGYLNYSAKGVSTGKYYSRHNISDGPTFGVREWDSWWESTGSVDFYKRGTATTNLTASKRDVLAEGMPYWRGSSSIGTYYPYSGASGKKRYGFLVLTDTDSNLYYEVDDIDKTGLISDSSVRIYSISTTEWILGDHTSDGYWRYNGQLSQFTGDPAMTFIRVWNGSGPDPTPGDKILSYSHCLNSHSYISYTDNYANYVNARS